MQQDYTEISLDEHELLEKQTLRTLTQAVQEYSAEAKVIFETTEAASKAEIIVLAEDLVQYALEVAECFPINRRFAGFIDYKRVRWLSTPFGIFPQSLLVDAKASTENNRETLQQSQLPMDAEFVNSVTGATEYLTAGFPPHLPLTASLGATLSAVTTSAFIHFYYSNDAYDSNKFRRLHSIYLLLIPHQRLKPRYNPDSLTTFWGVGKHSSARGEDPRIRVYFDRLRGMCPWRVQELRYSAGASGFAEAKWRDYDAAAERETHEPFYFIGR